MKLFLYYSYIPAAASSAFDNISAVGCKSRRDYIAYLTWHTSDFICKIIAADFKATSGLGKHLLDEAGDLVRQKHGTSPPGISLTLFDLAYTLYSQSQRKSKSRKVKIKKPPAITDGYMSLSRYF
jgi:hypothetical protein